MCRCKWAKDPLAVLIVAAPRPTSQLNPGPDPATGPASLRSGHDSMAFALVKNKEQN